MWMLILLLMPMTIHADVYTCGHEYMLITPLVRMRVDAVVDTCADEYAGADAVGDADACLC